MVFLVGWLLMCILFLLEGVVMVFWMFFVSGELWQYLVISFWWVLIGFLIGGLLGLILGLISGLFCWGEWLLDILI